jgi:DNA mismatch repair protein MutS
VNYPGENTALKSQYCDWSWQQGRLAEEAGRLREIFQHATRYSLVLLNESLSSTTPDEALFLARDVLCGLRAIGVRGLYATHLIELAAHTGEIERMVPGDSAVISLVAGIRSLGDGKMEPTFQITRGAPLGYSYAQEIARRHGISLDQILDAQQKRQDKHAQ